MGLRVFISYQRGDLEPVTAVTRALQEAGVPPWQDVQRLTAGAPSADEIRRVIREECCGAVVWLSEKALASPFVTGVEIPALLRRAESGDFALVPVFVDVTPESANAHLRKLEGVEIAPYNGHVLDPGLPMDHEATAIARRFVHARLTALAGRSTDRPVVRVVTRADTAGSVDTSWLDFDWRSLFAPSRDPLDSDRRRALQALFGSIEALLGMIPSGPIRLDARCHLSVGVALGYSLRQPTGAIPEVAVGNEWWTARQEAEGEPYLVASNAPGSPSSKCFSLELSLTQDVEAGVNATIAAEGLEYARRVKLRPPDGPSRSSVSDAVVANRIADEIVREALDTRRELGATDIDMYLSCPLPVATFIGWRLNAVGRVRVLEWEPVRAAYTVGLSLP